MIILFSLMLVSEYYNLPFFSIVLGQSFNFFEVIRFSLSKSSDILFLLFTSILIRFLLEKAGQSWIRTFSQTVTLILLPVITYIITSVISGNIALSLGMVGALSIVRFRNPVRSPFELSVYFASITMGIATATNINWLFFIIFTMIFISVFIKSYSKIYKRIYKTNLFNISFSEGNVLSTLEVVTKNELKILNESRFLKSKSFKNNVYNYLLGSNQFAYLKETLNQIIVDENIISYQLNE